MHLTQRLKADQKVSKGQRLAAAGRFEEAIRQYDTAVSLAPQDLQIQIHRSMALSAEGRHGEAISALCNASIDEPASSVFPQYEGIIRYDAGEFLAAQEAFSRASSLDPTNDLVRAYQHLVAMVIGSVSDGYPELRESASRVHASCQSRVLLYCEQCLMHDPGPVEPLFLAIAAEERRKRAAGLLARPTNWLDRGLLNAWYAAAKAVGWIRLLGHPEERHARILGLEGARLHELEKFEEATHFLTLATDQAPVSDESKFRLAEIHLFAEEYETALRYLSEIDEDSWRQPYLEVTAIALFHLARYEEADERLSLLTALQPKRYLPPYYLGMCELAAGEPVEARYWFERAVSCLNPQITKKRLDEVVRLQGQTDQM